MTCWFFEKSVSTLIKSEKTLIKSWPKDQDPEPLTKDKEKTFLFVGFLSTMKNDLLIYEKIGINSY